MAKDHKYTIEISEETECLLRDIQGAFIELAGLSLNKDLVIYFALKLVAVVSTIEPETSGMVSLHVASMYTKDLIEARKAEEADDD